MRTRIMLLIGLLLLGGIGAEWWLDDGMDPAESADVTKMDGPMDPPPSPTP